MSITAASNPNIYFCYQDFLLDKAERRYFKRAGRIMFERPDGSIDKSYHNVNPIVRDHWMGAEE